MFKISYLMFLRILFIFYIFISINKISKADFFSTCNISKYERSKIEYVLKNGNSKFIPMEIDDIENESFKQALYLLSFYKDGSNFPEDMFNIIGLDIIKKIKRFQAYSINYILKTKKGKENDIKRELQTMELTNQDYLLILKNRYFQKTDLSNEYINSLLKKVFYEQILLYDDIIFLINKYEDKITDLMLSQQIKLRLWYKKMLDVKNIKKLIKSQSVIESLAKIEQFIQDISYKNKKTITLKNGKSKIVYKDITKEQQLKICERYLKTDEYVDLICLSKNKRDNNYVYNILQHNLNPIFLPEKWLSYKTYYVREKINENKLTEEDYDIIANSGALYQSDFYSQQFLAGFVAYLRKDYLNAVLHFNNCAQMSKFSEYNAKANYWLGLSYRKLGNIELEQKAFKRAKKKVFTMYGQLSATELNESPENNIKEYLNSFQEDSKILCNDINFIIGYLEQYHNTNHLSNILRSYINKQVHKHRIFNALMVIKNDFNKQYSKALGVYALKYNIATDDINFQKTNVNKDSLVNAVIKQESNFNLKAVSNKGAKGYMQIMPGTGKVLAQNMGLKFDKKKLLKDEEYNVKMGSFYIDLLLERYDYNKVLALAAYNAGGINVDKWIVNGGDPRLLKSNQEIAEWIEKIPFAQTREYVVKVLGYEMVYDVFDKFNH